MRNAFLVGVARSGIGALASALARAGVNTGSRREKPPAREPYRMGPSRTLAEIGEAQLAPAVPPEALLLEGRRWLAVPRVGAPLAASPEITAAMRGELRAPFALADPRFVWTLPAWVEEAPQAARICLVRHPALAATALVRAAAEGREPCEPELDLAGAFALWTAAYRRVLEHAGEGDWLFCEFESLTSESSRGRLEAFTKIPLSSEVFRPELARPVPEIDVPEAARSLWRTLSARCAADGCARGGHAPRKENESRRVAAVCVIDERTRAHVSTFLARCTRQRGVRVDPVLVDATTSGTLAADTVSASDVTIVREPRPGFGPAAHAALAAVDAEWLAWFDPAGEEAPHRLAVQLAAAEREGAELVTCDLAIADHKGRLVRTETLAPWDEAPPANWTGGLLARREALAGVRPLSFAPSALERLRTSARRGRATHIGEALVAFPGAVHGAARERGREDAALLDLAARPHEGPPKISVLLATYRRRDVLLECLESFARQLVPPGTFEIVCVDDGSEDGTAELAGSLRLPVPFTFVSQPRSGPARARNTGLELARAPLVLFVNDDTIAFPDLVRRHLEAHRHGDGRTVFLGTFEQPSEHRRIALTQQLESSSLIFGYGTFDASGEVEPQRLYTCNTSAPTDAIREVGGFDEAFERPAGEDTDLGLRLAERGFRIEFLPAARALHRHHIDVDDFRRRQLMVADAHVELYAKHPSIIPKEAFGFTRESLCHTIEAADSEMPALLAAARSLGSLDTQALAAVPDEYRDHCEKLLASVRSLLGENIVRLHNLSWTQGVLDGLERRGVHSLVEWIARGASIEGDATVLFADAAERPRWPGAIERWVARVACGGTDLGGRLRVIVPPDGAPIARVREAVAGIRLRAREAGADADVRVEVTSCSGPALGTYLAGARWLPAGGGWDAELARLGRRVGVRILDLGSGAAGEPWLLSTAAAVRILAHPRWNDSIEMCALARAAAQIAGTNACLVLRHDPGRDGDLDEATEALRSAVGKALRCGAAPDLLIEAMPAQDGLEARLARSCDLFLSLAGHDEAAASFPPRRVVTTEDLAEHLVHRLAEVRALTKNSLPTEVRHA